MPFVAKLNGGPYNGRTLKIQKEMETIALGIDDAGIPDQRKPPIGFVIYKRMSDIGSPMLYELLGFKRPSGEPYMIEFVDGPGAGLHPAPRPAQFLEARQPMPIREDGTLFRGVGEIVGEAIYERRPDGDSWKCFFVGIDRSPDRVGQLMEVENERRITAAMKNFYESPNYGIYSKPPTDDHQQVLVEVGERRAHIDEKIAPLIAAVWGLEMETLGSCQQIHSKEKVTDRAYIGFPKAKDAKRFVELLNAAGIDCVYEPKTMTIARNDDAGDVVEKLTFDTANVKFDSADIDRIVQAVQSAAQSN